ncbi:MAG TPA: hypothetical protein VF602_01930 [Pedobacter sp.]
MKRLVLFLLFLPFLSIGQPQSTPIRISKIEIDSKKSFYFKEGDSIASIVIDSLIMKDKSQLHFFGKKKVNLIINYAEIGKNVFISGSDNKNNGTELNLSVNLKQLNSLFIDVSGKDARSANRRFDNGNGGMVAINYLAAGIKPQTTDKKRSGYLAINNRGGGATVNPQNDVSVLLGQIRNGSGRPLGQLPNGRIYSGNVGIMVKRLLRK